MQNAKAKVVPFGDAYLFSHFTPWHMHQGYGSHLVCECVYYHAIAALYHVCQEL